MTIKKEFPTGDFGICDLNSGVLSYAYCFSLLTCKVIEVL